MHRVRAQSIAPHRAKRSWLTLGVCIVLASLIWAVFGQTLRYDFVNYDDPRYVYQNTRITSGLNIAGVAWAFSHIHAENWHPLTTITHMLDCQLYGLNAGGHHFTNVLFQTVAVVLLFVVLQQMTGALWRSAFVAAVFAIHPLHVESVSWVAERKDVLSGVFFMLTLFAYVHYVRAPSIWRYLMVIFIGVTMAAVILRKKAPFLITGWFWYLGMLVPVIGLVQVGWQGHADRYTYLPQIGLYIAGTWAVADLTASWRRRRIFLGAVALLLIGALSCCAWIQTSYWRDSETLFTHALAVTRHNDVAENNLGIIFLQKGQLDDAISRLQAAIDLRPENGPAHDNLAKALLQKGRVAEAMVHYRKFLEIEPENVEARNILGTALIQQGRIREAIEQWQEAQTIEPENGNAASNLAWVFATCPDDSIRDGRRAVELAEKALRISGGKIPMIFRVLAAAYAEDGRLSQAIESAQRGADLANSQGNSALAAELQSNIALYQTGTPLRDPSLAAGGSSPQ